MQADFLNQLSLQGLSISAKQLEMLALQERDRVVSSLRAIAASYSQEQEVLTSIKPFSQVVLKNGAQRSSLIANGEVAFLFLAGGQSTRFQGKGWKGTYPVFQGKSIIELLLEKLSRIDAKVKLPVSFLVSNETLPIVKEHLKTSSYSYDLIVQNSWPVLSLNKELYFQNGTACFAPSGNGLAPYYLMTHGLVKKWKEQGIKYVAFVLIDNPLINLEDPGFWHAVEEQSPQVALKAIERKPFESIGALTMNKGKIELLEASWFADQKEKGQFDESQLSFPWGNAGFMAFSMDFLNQMAEQPLPIHLIAKVDPILGRHFRFEQFLTDYLSYSTKTLCYAIDRDEEFAPLKKPEDLDLIWQKLNREFELSQ